MSDHFDAEDSRTDLTDLYIFPASGADRTVLVLDFNPDATAADISFDPDASYEIKIDTDGDLEPDVAFHTLFAISPEGASTASVFRATGAEARETGRVGEAVVVDAPLSHHGSTGIVTAKDYGFFAGLRSDPHFKDPKGLRNNFQFTGEDPIARRNVFGVVLELPNAALGGSSIRLWARSTTLVDGVRKQVDQTGRPGTNITFNRTEEDLLAFDETTPADQRARFGEKFVAFLLSLGYPEPDARERALTFLPDVLEYDTSKPSEYPNGRRLTDDTADLIVALLTRGRITGDLAGPHTDLLDDFPFLGPPHPPELALTHVE